MSNRSFAGGKFRLAHRVPNERRKSWAVAYLPVLGFTTTWAAFPIRAMILPAHAADRLSPSLASSGNTLPRRSSAGVSNRNAAKSGVQGTRSSSCDLCPSASKFNTGQDPRRSTDTAAATPTPSNCRVGDPRQPITPPASHNTKRYHIGRDQLVVRDLPKRSRLHFDRPWPAA